MIVEYSKGAFIVNPESQLDENGEPTPEKALHETMLSDFQDEAKKEYFITLLNDNPDTAFSIYHNL